MSTLNELTQPLNLVPVIGQYGGRSLSTLEPLVDLPDALNRPAEIRVTFSDADHFVYVTRRTFAYGVWRIDETEIIVARRHNVDRLDRVLINPRRLLLSARHDRKSATENRAGDRDHAANLRDIPLTENAATHSESQNLCLLALRRCNAPKVEFDAGRRNRAIRQVDSRRSKYSDQRMPLAPASYYRLEPNRRTDRRSLPC